VFIATGEKDAHAAESGLRSMQLDKAEADASLLRSQLEDLELFTNTQEEQSQLVNTQASIYVCVRVCACK